MAILSIAVIVVDVVILVVVVDRLTSAVLSFLERRLRSTIYPPCPPRMLNLKIVAKFALHNRPNRRVGRE